MTGMILLLLGATIQGKVTEFATSEPIAGVDVYLEGTDYATYTDGTGYYRLSEIPPGFYTLTVSLIGYKSAHRDVNIKSDVDKPRIDIALQSAPITVGEVEVSSRRAEFEQEVTISSYRIDLEDVKSAPVIFDQDLFRTLMTLPGVTFTSDFNAALYVRGGSPDQNLILLDNMILYNPFHLGGFFSTFMLDAVGSVEFLTGGFPVSYGNRLSAVLAVESASPMPLGGYLSTSLLATEGAMWGRAGQFGGIVTARRTYFDQIIPLILDFRFPYHFEDVHAVGVWEPSQRTRIGLTAFYTNDRLDLTGENIPIELGWNNQQVSVRLVQDVGEDWLAQVWLGWSRYGADMSMSDLVSMDDRIDDFSTRACMVRIRQRSTFEFGGEWSYLRFIYNTDAEPFAVYDIDGRPQTGAGYLSWKYKPSEKFLLQAGTRLTYYYALYPDSSFDTVTQVPLLMDTTIDTLENFYLEPEARVSAKYFLTSDDAINLSVGNYFQNLAMLLPEGGRIPTNFWIPVFGKYEPQQALHFIAGYEHIFADDSRARIEPYYKHYLNLLAFNEALDISDVDENMFSSGGGRAYGVDFSIEKLSGHLTGWISYSLAFSRFISDTAEFYTSFDRRHSLNVVASYRFDHDWRLNANFTFATGMPYAGTLGRYRVWYWDPVWQDWRYEWYTIEADRNTLRFPAYHRLDIGGSKKWRFRWGELTVRADVINIYNHKNVLLYYYDLSNEPPTQERVTMIPIFPSVGVEVRF